MIHKETIGQISILRGTVWDEAVEMVQNLARVEAEREAARIDGAVADVCVKESIDGPGWEVHYSEGKFTIEVFNPTDAADKKRKLDYAEQIAEKLREEIRGSRQAALQDFAGLLLDLRGGVSE